jgi:hypothetical protein
MEIFQLQKKPKEERICPADKWIFDGGWSYLCFWHFQWVRLRGLLRLGKRIGYSDAEDGLTDEELADLDESLEDVRCGRGKFAPKSLSDEEFLEWLKN